jgi:hypothetical protein
MKIRLRFLLVLADLVWLPLIALPAPAATAPLPSSIASIGDSITQAHDVCCYDGNHPGNSWSTGAASWDGITRPMTPSE